MEILLVLLFALFFFSFSVFWSSERISSSCVKGLWFCVLFCEIVLKIFLVSFGCLVVQFCLPDTEINAASYSKKISFRPFFLAFSPEIITLGA